MTFSRGALIIPMNSTFQTRCGQVSAYGLVYRILQANGPGHRNAGSPVTVYLLNDPSKGSVNRCRPTNTAKLSASVSPSTDALWFTGTKQAGDGCDAHIENSAEVPVWRVPYGGTWPGPGNVFAGNRISVYDEVDGAWPKYQALSTSDLSSPTFMRASYGGAPFVIDAPDAQKVFDLLKDGDQGSNQFPQQALKVFTTACTCNGLSTQTASSGALSYTAYPPTAPPRGEPNPCHYVDMHQATTNFTAQVERRLNVPPKTFALYDPDYGNGTSTSYDSRRATVLTHLVLERYLMLSGLWLTGTSNNNDSIGCPVGNVSGCAHNGSTGTVGTPATAAQAKPGVIFDRFTTEDLNFTNGTYPDGILNRKTGTYLDYALFWAPHWAAAVDGRGDDNKAVSSITKFVNAGGNVMGECASITSWENGLGSVGPARFLFAGGIDYSRTNSIYDGSNNNTRVSYSMQSDRKNCGDPGVTAPCVDYFAPGNIFSQVGDWTFNPQPGYTEAQRPTGSTTRRSFNKRMLAYRDNATLADDFDIFNMGQQDASHGVVVYVGGHEVSGDPLGSRIVLNSMLNLGGIPLSAERALAAPTIVYARADAPAYVDQVITPTFDAVSGYSSNPAVRNFDPSNSANLALWTWPYYPGHFRSHAMSGLAPGEQAFSSALIFDSSQLNTPTGIRPSPRYRNLVTWLGGYPKSIIAMTNGAKARNNVLQVGWTPETIDGTVLDRSGACPVDTSRCVDVMGVAPKVSAPLYDGLESGLRMVVGSDGLCDVQELLNFSKINSGNDWGSGASDCNPNNIKRFVDDTPKAAWLLQRVRGYCYTGGNSNYTPGDSDCVDRNDNRAHLGGLVHSAAAVMGPSDNVPDVGGKRRPTVAFVAGYDGQLHAFYVGGGAGYQGPVSATFNEDNNATTKFKTDYASIFLSGSGLPAPGTELWSFLPASQLPWLETNAAQVDSSPVIMDVFADFSGTGKREWHSLLLLSLGGQSSELIALDVTNPLVPRLLWDNTGSLHVVGSTPAYSPNIVMNDSNGALPGTALAPKYKMVTDGSLPSGFRQDLVGYRKAYDLRDLGGTAGLSSSQIRIGLEPVYMVYAVSNMPGGRNGIEVYAIEASTGQVVWQWEREYSMSNNPVPTVATVISGSDGASRVLIGDQEGRIWELNAATGENLNVSVTATGCSTTTPCHFPLVDLSDSPTPQPITTNVALARVPTGIPAAASLKPYEGERVILFGTAGADWIGSPGSVAGAMHARLYEQTRRVPVATGSGMQLDGITPWTLSSAVTFAERNGVAQEPSDFPRIFAAGERVYGTITVAGSVAYFSTAFDRITDVMTVGSNIRGSMYSLDLGEAQAGSLTTTYSGSRAAYGGVAVYVDPTTRAVKGLVTAQSSSLNYVPSSGMNATTVTNSKGNDALRVGENQGIAYRLLGWVRRWLK